MRKSRETYSISISDDYLKFICQELMNRGIGPTHIFKIGLASLAEQFGIKPEEKKGEEVC